jgi:putative addiction module component (TIGR02574 family)
VGQRQGRDGRRPLSDAQKAELDRRIADVERDPQSGESWEVVRSRNEKRLGKAE